MIGVYLRVVLVLTFCAYFSLDGIFAQQDVVEEEADPDTAYCFQFTWLGPKWDNNSQLNTTCSNLKAKPCHQPLVITHDGSPPNTTHMWYNYNIGQITCKLITGEACTKWVSYYGNEVMNITYMCSKYSVDGVTKTDWEGCETQYNATYSTTVCACRSAKGTEPCNSAHTLAAVHGSFLLLLFLLVPLYVAF